MNKTLIAFFLALFMLLFSRAILPNMQLMVFAPFFVLLFFRSSFITALWIVFACGIIADLFSFVHFGQTALCYLLVAALLYRQRRYFNEKPGSFALYTIIISFFITLFAYPLEAIFNKPIVFSSKGCFIDLIIMPLIDGIYALLWFFYPIALIEYMIKLTKRFLAR